MEPVVNFLQQTWWWTKRVAVSIGSGIVGGIQLGYSAWQNYR